MESGSRIPRRRATWSAAVAGLLLAAGSWLGSGPHAGAQEQQEGYARTPPSLRPYRGSPDPYRRFFLTPPEFRGPGREAPDAVGLETIRIGLLAPLEGTRDDALGSGLMRGVQLALEQANAAGGYGGIPFELIARNDQQLWGSSSNTLVQFAYHHRVWALIGSIDSNSTHVALRAALKAELPIVNVGSTDPTVTETAIPWIIRTTPDDRQTGYRLARLLFEERGAARVAVLRASDRYGRFGIREFLDAARRLQHPLAMEILFEPGTENYDDVLERVSAAAVDALVLWASAEDAARIVIQARARGLRQPIFGTDRLASNAFLEAAGEAAEGVEATAWMVPNRDDDVWNDFRSRYRERFGVEPDTWSAYGYDAATLTAEAVQRAGLNHARIMDALGSLREYHGVAGPMFFDTTWNNVAEPLVVRVEEGRFVIPYEPVVAAPASAAPLRLGVLASGDEGDEGFAAGAAAAAADINAAGGVAGRPLELLWLGDRSPWRDGASLIARLSAAEGLIGLVGASDGATAHVAAQIANRHRVPFVSASGENSLTRAGARWVLRGVPSDSAQAEMLLRTALGTTAGAHAALVVPAGREGRERLAALREACREVGVAVTTEITEPETTLATVPVDALLLWLDPPAALRFLRSQDTGPARVVIGSLRLADRGFLDSVADLIDELWLPSLSGDSQATSNTAPAGLGARLGDDFVRILAASAAESPDDPETILSALLRTRTFVGRTGALSFDASGNRTGGMTVAAHRGRAGETP